MSTFEQTKNKPNAPLLMFKVGVLGSAPLDMAESIAKKYDAQLLSSDFVRKHLIDMRDNQGMSPALAQDIKVAHIREIIALQATPLLAAGDDVVIDMFFNRIRSREFPIELAKDCGGFTVALCVETPPSIINDRVKLWTDNDSFIIPVNRWSRSPMQASQAMRGDLQLPREEEKIDYTFKLKGHISSQHIVRQVDVLMESHNLLF